ncbi:dimethyladenosine transferase 1, mitochondrial [Caerostris extrusa]|uniref:rRNA adenine N(6)-methyltransferase n=1 Tax=Caerostris extrusa TaxID=172846 RepID=A0AAV4PLB9_CAEEX|nr:dimethyladenosine transferase 1, mitochondrial [Caerostris extrusa]
MVRLSFIRFAEAVVKEATSSVEEVIKPKHLRLPPLPSPRDILKLYKIQAQRHLSQNFLLDARLNNKIVTRTGNMAGCYVCEVGPGPGNITRCILQNGAKHVIVVEKDRRFVPALELLADASDNRMKIILGDIMDLNLESILPRNLAREWTLDPPPLYIIGNLPFNISTALIIKWLKHCSKRTGPFIHGRTQLTLTFQKEVAYRMMSQEKQEFRSRLSIMWRAFFPKPDVDVCVLKFTPRIKPLINQPFELVEKVVFTLFHHRQKYCLYNIKNLFPLDRPDLVEEMVKKSGIDPEKRSFQLYMEDFNVLCEVYNDICKKNQGIFEYNYLIHKKLYLKNKSSEDSIVDNNM